MNINENLQKWRKNHKNNIDEHISAQKHHQTMIDASFYILIDSIW